MKVDVFYGGCGVEDDDEQALVPVNQRTRRANGNN